MHFPFQIVYQNFPFVSSFPFEMETPIGFIVGVAILLTFSITFYSAIILTISLLIGFFIIMVSFCQNYQRKCSNLNINYQIGRDEMKLRNELRELFHFHTKVKELRIFTNCNPFWINFYFHFFSWPKCTIFNQNSLFSILINEYH